MLADLNRPEIPLPDVDVVRARIKAIDAEATLLRRLVRLLNRIDATAHQSAILVPTQNHATTANTNAR